MLNQSLQISILGPQGSGKGTQAELLGKRLKIPYISMGQMLRHEIRTGTARGKLVKNMVESGSLVPCKITLDLLKARTVKSDCKKGFIIDGFPRKLDQYRAWKKQKGPNCVIVLELSNKEAIDRLDGRRVCGECNAIYHVDFKPPKKKGICDKCQGKLIIRHDDKPAVIRDRLNLYYKETDPVVRAYEKDGILYRIDASRSIKKIHQAILHALKI